MSQEVVPDSDGFPQSFEILEMVFMHLPGELNNLKKVCQRFYQVIINSFPLMERCEWQWNIFSEHLFRSPGRKFRNVRFYNTREEAPDLLQFVRLNHLTLNKIDYSGCDLKSDEFHELLSLVAGTVKEMVWMSSLEGNAGHARVILPKLKSLTLAYKTVRFFDYTGTDYKIFAPNLRKFDYFEGPEEPKEETTRTMLEFLRSSVQLEVLKLRSFLARKVLAVSRRVPFDFPLRELRLEVYELDIIRDNIDNANMRRFRTPDLPLFLATCVNSLTHLVLENAVLCSSDICVIIMMQIKRLEISTCRIVLDATIVLENRSIEKFIFRRLPHAMDLNADSQGVAVGYLLYCCRGLRSIEFINGSLDLSWLSNMSRIDSLTDLKFDSCTGLWSHHFPKLATLTIVKNRNACEKEVNEVSQLIAMNPQLKKISVPMSFRDNQHLFEIVSNGTDVEYN